MNFASEFRYDWFSPIEPTMTKWVPRGAKSIVEVGSFEGKSTLWFLERCREAQMTVIDHFAGGPDQQDARFDLVSLFSRFAVNIREHERRVKVLKFDTWEAWNFVPRESADVVFVDGSHIAGDILWDLVNAYRVARVGGILIADDYSWNTHRPDCPKVAIDAFATCFKGKVDFREVNRVVVFEKLC